MPCLQQSLSSKKAGAVVSYPPLTDLGRLLFMGTLANKRILLGVTGGIAAYKSADLVRRLQAAAATVRVAMSPAATECITPLTFQTLSGSPAHVDLLELQAEAAMGHIELARGADLMVIAPATADFLAKLASGAADNLFLAICFADPAPI